MKIRFPFYWLFSLMLSILCASTDPVLANDGFSAIASVRFHDEPATPIIINGKPVLEHRYFGCIDQLQITFSKPVDLATLSGHVYGFGTPNFTRAFVLRQIPDDLKHFTFVASGDSFCNDASAIQRIIVAKDVRSSDGDSLGTNLELSLRFPPSHD